ncbi:MAG: nucleotide exchange factor GrpE [Alphaproteobacteria bacterium]|nr:nucleotide exchange factor GrpE [Alphaproteobacteria bacterium]
MAYNKEKKDTAEHKPTGETATPLPQRQAAPPEQPVRSPTQSAMADTPATEQPTAEEKITTLELEIIEINTQLLAAKDSMLRALADADNSKKRAARESEDTKKYAPAGFARDILPVIDTLAEAIKSIGDQQYNADQIKKLLEGLEMSMKIAVGALEKSYIMPVAAVGDKFDSHFHQALSTMPCTEKEKKDSIAQILQQGYKLHDRLIRPALVVVYQ